MKTPDKLSFDFLKRKALKNACGSNGTVAAGINTGRCRRGICSLGRFPEMKKGRDFAVG